ncbi:FlgK family flagellar hook-associated protein [Curvivirga sp.]|uniref:FlgK family flagellar hook-associated protein n=1 Tax=Curvivirga sp. TaxID=2856848 RepID=UPI003B5CC782
MSLVSALNIAVSSVNSINTAIATVSDNVANAENEDYNAREANFANVQTGGVRISDITRKVNEGLFDDLSASISNTAQNEVLQNYYERIEDLLGVTGSETPLIDYVENLNTAWKAFEAAPESDAAERQVILAAENLTREIGRISTALDTVEQSLRADINATVDTLNDTLAEIDRLNDAIVRDKAKGLPVSHLENLRDEQLLDLSEIMTIDYIRNEDGSMSVFATSGMALTVANASTFTWDEDTHSLTKSGSTSTDLVVDGRLSDGKLRALIEMGRTDDAAVNNADGIFNPVEKLRNQLDEFAFALVDDSAARTKGNVFVENQSDLTSLTGITAGQTITINAGGQAAASTITITAGMSTSALVTAINAVANVEARVDAHGHLQILTSTEGFVLGGTALTGLGLTAGTYNPDEPPSLNYAYAEEYSQGTANIGGNADLTTLAGVTAGNTFTVSVGGAAPTTITIGASPYSTSDLLADLNAIEGVRAYTTDDGFLNISTVEGDLVIQETAGTPLSGANSLGLSFNGSNAAVTGAANTGELKTGFFEVVSGTPNENASRINIRVNDVLSDGSSSLKDGSGSVMVESLSSSNRDASGSGLTLTDESYTGLVSGLISDITTRSQRYDGLFKQDQSVMNNLNTKLRNEVGVDIDEEMALLTVLQNSYAASARVISTVNEMFQSLEQAVR